MCVYTHKHICTQNKYIFIQLGFSSNVVSETVVLINFVKNLNLCGRLHFDSLVAKPFW